jgi:hypothetical protein
MNGLKLFYSYAHEDEALKDELMRHLAALRREGLIEEWHDSKIAPGSMWDPEIREQIRSADIILLLVSSDSLSSRYVNDVEIREAMRRHDLGEAVIVPVILRPSDWEPILGPFQALPTRGKPVTTWPNRDEALLDIARGIRKTCERLRARVDTLGERGEAAAPVSVQSDDLPPDAAALAGATVASLAGPLGDRRFVDRLVTDVVNHLREKHRILVSPLLPLEELIPELDILFDRKTFRHESLSDCVTQGWALRLHPACQTLVVLRAYQRNVRDKGSPTQYDLFKKVIDEVDGYCMRMAEGLFDRPIEIEQLTEHVGTQEFERRLPSAQKFPKGSDGRLELARNLAVVCDGHRVEAISAMDQIVRAVSGR